MAADYDEDPHRLMDGFREGSLAMRFDEPFLPLVLADNEIAGVKTQSSQRWNAVRPLSLGPLARCVELGLNLDTAIGAVQLIERGFMYDSNAVQPACRA